MKSRFPLVFLWVLFCLASFAVIDCSKNEEKNLASGYTEENNAWNGLDSTLAKLLETWDSEVASDSVERRGTGEAEGKSWYEVEFMTEGEVVYVKEDDSSKSQNETAIKWLTKAVEVSDSANYDALYHLSYYYVDKDNKKVKRMWQKVVEEAEKAGDKEMKTKIETLLKDL